MRVWSWLAVNLGKRAGAVTLVGLIITMGLGYGITRLEFATGQDSYLNADEQVYEDNVAYQELFGGQAMISVITMDDGVYVDQLFSPENLATQESVAEDIRSVPGVQGLIDPIEALEFSTALVTSEDGNPFNAVAAQALTHAEEVAAEEGDTASVEARQAAVAETAERLLAAGEPSLDNPEWVKFLLYQEQNPEGGGEIRKALEPFFPDDRHALAITRLEGNQSIEAEGDTAVAVLDASENLRFDDAEVVTTGAPVLLKDINDYLRGGMLSLGGLALAVMALILIIFFNVRWRLLPLAVVTVGVIWAFGLTGYAGISLTLVTIAGLPVMLGVGIDYAIQMHSRIEEEVIIDRSPHPIQEAARRLGGPMLVVTANAVLAFLAILASKTPMIREFGLLLAVGIVAICISSIVNPLAILGIREYKRPTVGKSWTDGTLAHFVNRLGSLPAGIAVVLMVLATAVFAGGVVAEEHLEIQTDPIRWVNQDSEVIENITELEEQIGGSSELGVYVVADEGGTTFTDETVEYVDRLTIETLENYPERLLVGSGIVGTVSDLTEVEGAEHVPPTAESVQAAWDLASEDIKLSTASPDGGAMNIIMLTGKGSLEDRAPIAEEINARDDAARGRAGHALGPGRGGHRAAREPDLGPDLPDLPGAGAGLRVAHHRLPLRRSVPAGHGPGADRRGHVVARGLLRRLQAESHDRGGRPAGGRGMHRVHHAHPLPLPGGAAPGAGAPGGDRRRRSAHGTCLRGVGPDHHGRRRRHRRLLAAVAAGLRHHRGHQRDRRPPVGARGPAPSGGVGRQAGLGVQGDDGQGGAAVPRRAPHGGRGQGPRGRGPRRGRARGSLTARFTSRSPAAPGGAPAPARRRR